jgi:hypothetical protein
MSDRHCSVSGVSVAGLGVLAAGADLVRNGEEAIIASSTHVAAKREPGSVLL